MIESILVTISIALFFAAYNYSFFLPANRLYSKVFNSNPSGNVYSDFSIMEVFVGILVFLAITWVLSSSRYKNKSEKEKNDEPWWNNIIFLPLGAVLYFLVLFALFLGVLAQDTLFHSSTAIGNLLLAFPAVIVFFVAIC